MDKKYLLETAVQQHKQLLHDAIVDEMKRLEGIENKDIKLLAELVTELTLVRELLPALGVMRMHASTLLDAKFATYVAKHTQPSTDTLQ